MSDENYDNVPRTDNLDLPLPSEVEDATELEDEWGNVLDELLIKRLDSLLGGGEGELDLAALSTEELNNVFHAENFSGANGGEMIQNALEKAASEPGTNRVVVGPNGPDSPTSAPESNVWEVTHINIDYDDVELVGKGWPMLFLQDGSNDDIIRNQSDTEGEPTRNVRIRGFRLHGNRANNDNFSTDPSGGAETLKGSCGIRPVNAENWTIEWCHVKNCRRFGIEVKMSHHVTVRDCWGENCGDDAFTTSNEFFQSQDLSDVLFERLYAFNNDDQGIEIEDGSTNVIVRDCWMENNLEGGTVKAHPATNELPCENVSWENCTFKGNSVRDLRFYGTDIDEDLGHTVDGCTIIVEGSNAGLTLGIGNDQLMRGVTVRDTTIIVRDATNMDEAIDLKTNMVKRDLDIEATIKIEDDASTANGVTLLGGNNITLNLTIIGNGLLKTGILAQPQYQSINDLTISPETHVQGCLQNGLVLSGHDNSFSKPTIRGTYKNNGQNTGVGSSQRAGVRLTQATTGPDISDAILDGVRAYDDQGQTQRYGIELGQCNRVIASNINVRGNDGADINIASSATDTRLSGEWVNINDNGVRTTQNGWGTNAGDPSSTGQWNGSGREGVNVYDETNGVKYSYVAGGWR